MMMPKAETAEPKIEIQLGRSSNHSINNLGSMSMLGMEDVNSSGIKRKQIVSKPDPTKNSI